MSTALPHQLLDRDAVSIVSRLQRRGYTAFLVGGCVRDLLLGREPKDFDIATSASPEECKEVFGRRCRLIGRRFKLAHIRAGANIYEVATFRGPPEDQEVVDTSGFVVRANTYGTPEQDAISRDFTMNGLFYDPISGTIHDHVGGQDDIGTGTIRTIGDALQRFREDPVRLLRAIKFSARLGMTLHPDIVAVAEETAPLVHDCPVARVTEEFFRILETGHATASIRLMKDLGVLGDLMPEVATIVLADDERWSEAMTWLPQVDRLVRAHGVLPRESTFGLLVWPLVRQALQSEEMASHGDWGAVVADLTYDAVVRMGIPQRHRHLLRAVANLMRRLTRPSRRGRRSGMLRTPALAVTLSLLRIEFLLTGEHQPLYEEWTGELVTMGLSAAPIEPRLEDLHIGQDADARRPGRRKPRRRRRGKRSADATEATKA
ncbi:MAG: polynucleotide adenylyltransferase PcnB [Myxococcota bacterium]|nr:polynucleotide adenylyltransferase PcnB [Myxococcota bacterium]